MVSAVEAIHDAGSHAMAASPSRSTGNGAARQAASPTSVATGAAGAASRFASTPYTGTVGRDEHEERPARQLRRDGNRRARARAARGSRRPRPSASGRANRSSDAVADADSANPSEVASQGSATSRIATASDSIDMPAPDPPEEHPQHRDRGHRRGADDARLGGDEQHEARERGEAAADPDRTRGPPARRRSANASPTTSAQLAPETAVRCESEDCFISASSCSDDRGGVAHRETGDETCAGSGEAQGRRHESLAQG